MAVVSLILLAAAGICVLIADAGRNDPVVDTVGYSLPLAPDFELERLDGGTFRLSSEHGRVVVLNMWATWCAPCLEEIPDLISIQDEMTGDVVVVGVSVDQGNPAAVRSFVEEYGMNYPVVIDDGAVTDAYGPIFGIPTSFLIDRAGRLQLQASGMITKEQLKPVLERLVAGEVIDEPVPGFQRIRKAKPSEIRP